MSFPNSSIQAKTNHDATETDDMLIPSERVLSHKLGCDDMKKLSLKNPKQIFQRRTPHILNNHFSLNKLAPQAD